MSAIDNYYELLKERDSLRTQLATAQAEVERLNKECVDNQDWINSLCKELCTMEDSLGFANDQHDQTGRWVPTIGPWLERVRDLIAAEGELGDAKSDLAKRDEVLRVALEMLEFAQLFYIKRHSEKTGSIETPYDKAITAIQSCLNTTSEGEK
jgi:hypothetical protein